MNRFGLILLILASATTNATAQILLRSASWSSSAAERETSAISVLVVW